MGLPLLCSSPEKFPLRSASVGTVSIFVAGELVMTFSRLTMKKVLLRPS